MAAALSAPFGRAGYASSIVSNENRAIFCTLLRNGSARAPAGLMASGEMSSPSFSSTGSSSASAAARTREGMCSAFDESDVPGFLDGMGATSGSPMKTVFSEQEFLDFTERPRSVILPVTPNGRGLGAAKEDAVVLLPERPGKFLGVVPGCAGRWPAPGHAGCSRCSGLVDARAPWRNQ